MEVNAWRNGSKYDIGKTFWVYPTGNNVSRFSENKTKDIINYLSDLTRYNSKLKSIEYGNLIEAAKLLGWEE